MTTRPIDATTSEKEYKLQDHLGSTRVVLHQGGAVLGKYDYEPYGGRLISTGPEPRKGFIDKEKDDESNLGDFGRRKYDDGIGRFTSVDPLWEMYRSWSPYVYSFNKPIQVVDPSGESGEAVIEGDQITVYSEVYFYTDKGKENLITQDEADKIVLEVMQALDGQKATVGNKEYTVKFHITAKVVSVDEVKKMRGDDTPWAKNQDIRKNFVKIVEGESQGESWMKGNSGRWALTDRDCKTYTHEWIHGLGYQRHDTYIRGSGVQPDMMIAQGAKVDAPWAYPDGTMDPTTRYVSPRNIASLIDYKSIIKNSLRQNGRANMGDLNNIPEMSVTKDAD